MAKIQMTVHVEFAGGTPAAGLHVAVHEVFTSNDYDLGVTDSGGMASGDLRDFRQMSVPDSPFCPWPGCPHHLEDDPLDRPGATITLRDSQAREFTTPGVPFHHFDHVHIKLPPHFSINIATPTPVGQYFRRKNLSTDFTIVQQKQLADLLFGYLNDALIDAHMQEVDHIDNLFTDHRSYAYEMEKRLIKDGHLQFVPLPFWEPLNNIPESWDRVKPYHGHSSLPLLPYNALPLVARPQIPDKLKPQQLCSSGMDTAQKAAIEIGRSAWSAPGSFHFNAHAFMGGPFVSMSTAGAALMFWAFHPLLVEVYDKWMDCTFADTGGVVVGRNVDSDGLGRMELFRLGKDNKLWHSAQRRTCAMRDDMDMDMGESTVTFDHWTHWRRVGPDQALSRVKVVTDGGGNLVVVARAQDSRLKLLRRTGSGWGTWFDLSADVFDCAAVVGVNGRLDVLAFFKVGSTHVVAVRTETGAGSNTFGGWTNLTGFVQPSSISAIADHQGQPHAFFRTGDGMLHHLWKSASGVWTEAPLLADFPVRVFEVRQNQDGRLEAFVVKAADDGVYHRWVQPGLTSIDWSVAATWSGWQRFGTLQCNHISVGRNDDGRLELFAVDVNGRVQHIWQVVPNGSWSNWEVIKVLPIMGRATAVAGAVVDHTKCLKVFVACEDRFLYMAEQAAPNAGPWVGWTNL